MSDTEEESGGVGQAEREPLGRETAEDEVDPAQGGENYSPAAAENVSRESGESTGSGRPRQSRGRASREQRAPNADPDGLSNEASGRVRRGCVVVGPTGAGKTTLLAGIYRACQMADDDDLDLTFAATDKKTSDLIKVALQSILSTEKGLSATAEVTEYPFHIGVEENSHSPWKLPSFTDLDIVLTDGGGGFIFDPTTENTEFRNKMTSMIRQASSLVLCVDSNAPNLPALYKEIESLLSDTRTNVTERVRNPPLGRLIHRFKTGIRAPEYVARPRTLLNVDRVLVLLSRVDTLMAAYDYDNAAHAAKHIDPVALARETLRPELLRSILKSLRSDAQLAVGICSSYGFMPDGEPFADSTGRPDTVPPRETGVDLLKYWTPFGVRDAIYFLATGQTRGTVKRVFEADLSRSKREIELRRMPPMR